MGFVGVADEMLNQTCGEVTRLKEPWLFTPQIASPSGYYFKHLSEMLG